MICTPTGGPCRVHFLLYFVAVLLTTILSAAATNAATDTTNATEKRFALVIGNSRYPTSPLANPVNDATDLSTALRQLRFDVMEQKNLDAKGMKSAIRDFSAKVKGQRNAVAIFFFAGHGVQIKGKNFLIPIGRDFTNETEIEDEAIEADLVFRRFEEAGVRVGITILDACRNNPYATRGRSLGGRGLNRMDAPSGMLVAFATAPGTEAADGLGRNGLYTKHLLSYLPVPNLTLEQVFKRTREAVETESEGRQSPREESSLKGEDFFFARNSGTGTEPPPEQAYELALWETVRQSPDQSELKTYLKEFPTGRFANLAKSRLDGLSAKAKQGQNSSPRVSLALGQDIPEFNLLSTEGSRIASRSLLGKGATLVYFHSVNGCDACGEGLKQMRLAAELGAKQGISVAAIGVGTPENLRSLGVKTSENFKQLIAERAVLDSFQLHGMYPALVVVDAQGKVRRVSYGSGRSSDWLQIALGEHMLEQNNAEGAKQLFKGVEGQGESAAVALSGVGYSLLREGRLEMADQIFRKMAQDDAQLSSRVRGHEGLAELALLKQDPGTAEREARSALRLQENRGPAQMILARLSALKGNSQATAVAISAAAHPSSVVDFSFQRSTSDVATGNLLRDRHPQLALSAYRLASQHNPWASEAWTNQSVVLQKTGSPEQAIDVLNAAKQINPSDEVAGALLRQMKDALAQKMDSERQRVIDDSVKELIARHAEQRAHSQTSPADNWTSSPIVVSILDASPQDTALTVGRLGNEQIFADHLSRQLIENGVTVVERAILDKLLAELKLGSSNLADPDVQLRLGRILASRLIAATNLQRTAIGHNVNARIIDTETTAILSSKSISQGAEIDPVAASQQVSEGIRRLIKSKFPLKGRIATPDLEAPIINLGTKHGVKVGQMFVALGDPERIELDGKTLGFKDKRLGLIEVTDVQELFATTRPSGKPFPIEKRGRVIASE